MPDITILPPDQLTVVIQSPPQITTVVEQPSQVTTEMVVGQGPAGPPGAPGPYGGQYEHNQGAASDSWVVNHNLGFRPNVTLLSVGGAEMIAEVLHMSENQARVYFDQPRAGLAVCS